jgi:hypothetical protein
LAEANRIDESVKVTNCRKSSVRAKVEHVFGVIERLGLDFVPPVTLSPGPKSTYTRVRKAGATSP